ncbi:hypothetical protein [Microcella sp.]|uniref:hypothetical protein n=1 Tax=Microcella sp. TaxID=1913979 RepID=UPI003F70F2F1
MGEQAFAWRRLVAVSAALLAVCGVLIALFLWGPLAPRFDDDREIIAGSIAVMGLVTVILMLVMLRPGSGYLRRFEVLDHALTELVGAPMVSLACHVRSDKAAQKALPELSRLSKRWPPILMFAVGPVGVAVGRAGRTPRTLLLAAEGDEVYFERGEAGGLYPTLLPTDYTPQIKVVINRDDEEFAVSLDGMIKEGVGVRVRDEAEVRELIASLSATWASNSADD